MTKKKATVKQPEKSKPTPRSSAGGKADKGQKEPSVKKNPIVGLGASAGGLEALKTFFAAVPEKSGLAYIVVVHMTPKQPSLMRELLQKTTSIPVLTAQDNQIIEPDHIYVMPPDKEITIYHGQIQLIDILKRNVILTIDLFLRSLALDQEGNAAAVILSGTGTDGTLGIKEIKTHEGLVLVQQENTAKYDGMPKSAINTGLVDMILPPQEMPAKLMQYFSQTRAASELMITGEKVAQQEALKKIFAVLRSQTGHDFSLYKVNTILRRINRRMGLNQIDDYSTYIGLLRKEPEEVDALFREFLIGVTSFFRDTKSFDVLKSSIFPAVLEAMSENNTFRAWIPGCSTGEEVYSLAIILHECLDKIPKRIELQLFGTDIDRYAIDRARQGIYPASIAADVSSRRLKRFFNKEGDFFRIRKLIRDKVVFSVQNVVKDPPFSRLNLLCCRNLLIYLDSDAQKRLLPLFHYTLNPGGILMLGSSETIGTFSNFFETLDNKWKVFRRREVPRTAIQMVDFPSGALTVEQLGVNSADNAALQKREIDIAALTQQALLRHFCPTAALIDARGQILHIQGRTGKYLEASSGPPSHNIIELAREGLRLELSSAFRSAKSSESAVVRKMVSVKTNGSTQMINLHIYPSKILKELSGYFLVVFEDNTDAPHDKGLQKADRKADHPESSRIEELERELQDTRENHQTTIEELESSNEELKSTNEELQSTNEELQSTNEELESSKEELQSLNEELQTVNAELQSKVDELSAAHDDMHNLLNSTEIATIFVDNSMCVRRFTAEAVSIVNLIQTDIGRPLNDVADKLTYDDMTRDLAEVIKKLVPKEIEVRTKAGKWYNMRIMPYRTTDNRIDGAVITFVEIEDQKKAQEILKKSIREVEQAWQVVHMVIEKLPDPMLIIESDGKIVQANSALESFMNLSREDFDGKNFYDLLSETAEGKKRQTTLQKKMRDLMIRGEKFSTEDFEIRTKEGKKRAVIDVFFTPKNKDQDNTEPCILLRFAEGGGR